MANPVDQVREEELARQAAALPPALRGYLGRAALRSQRQINSWPYYSKVLFVPTRNGAGPYTYDLAAGRARAFGYGIGGAVAQLGGTTLLASAGYSDTNIQEPYRTVKSERVAVHGVCLHIMPGSNPALLQKLWGNMSVNLIGGGGTVTQRMGPAELLPARSGLYGLGVATNEAPPLDAAQSPLTGFLNASNPVPGAYFPFPYDVMWGPTGSGADDQFGVEFDLERTIQVSAPADRVAAAGIQEWNAPSGADLSAALLVELVVSSEGKRSANQ